MGENECAARKPELLGPGTTMGQSAIGVTGTAAVTDAAGGRRCPSSS
ncbi:MAG: hypothetical protein LBE30_02130 [Comamonas sp.]|nr:hypothetical protein [Comamonas sp.]